MAPDDGGVAAEATARRGDAALRPAGCPCSPGRGEVAAGFSHEDTPGSVAETEASEIEPAVDRPVQLGSAIAATHNDLGAPGSFGGGRTWLRVTAVCPLPTEPFLDE